MRPIGNARIDQPSRPGSAITRLPAANLPVRTRSATELFGELIDEVEG